VNQEQEASSPGIVVLSSCLQLLHMNRRARALLLQLDGTAQGGAEQAVAAHLHRHCQEIIETLLERLGSKNWEQFHQFGTIGDGTRSILLKGFGIPDRRGLSHSRIVLLLSPHAPEPMSGMRKMAPEAGILEAESPRAVGMQNRFLFL